MDFKAKRCIQCGETKAPSEFYVNTRDGILLPRCKPCHNAVTLARYYARKAGLPPKEPKTEKRCTACGVIKPLGEFGLKVKSTGQLRSTCKPCTTAEHAKYNADREHRHSLDAAFRQRNRDRIAEQQRAWRLAHPDRAREMHSKYKATHKDAVNAATHRRRSTINGRGSFTAAEWTALKEKYDHRCLMCGRQEPEIRLAVDHIVPLSKGGMNTIDNLQPLCKSCNSKKHRGIIDLRAAWKGGR